MRFARLAATVFLIATIVFVILRVIPGDPAAVIAGLDADTEAVEAARERLGLDRPIVVQYGEFLWNAARFDFGASYFNGVPVRRLIAERVPLTFVVAAFAFAIALALALPLGVIGAVRASRPAGGLVAVYTHLGMSVPSFWMGILLLLVLSVQLGWFPLFGADTFAHLVLPALALGVARSASLTRIVRASVTEQLVAGYVTAAVSRGASPSRVVVLHVVRNALLPVITLAAIQFGALLGGAIIIEQVFSLPGLGRLLLSSIYRRDFPVVQAGVMLIAVSYSLINFAADILYRVVDPRLRKG